MTPNEYQALADFFVDQLGRVQEETRTVIQVSAESLRDEIRQVGRYPNIPSTTTSITPITAPST